MFAGDSLTYHNGMYFTTVDQDNDKWNKNRNCANNFKGGWWYNACHHSNLNGHYFYSDAAVTATGVAWLKWKNKWFSFMKAEMKVRPKSFAH